MFSRTWVTVLAGSLALWGMSRLGGGVSVSDVGPGTAVPALAYGAAGVAPAELAGCIDDVVSLDAPAAVDGSPVVQRYRERCRPLLGGAGFDAFGLVYGERARAVVLAILEREERLAAELVEGPLGASLDPDLVWAAALARAALDVRVFGDELSDWFDARAASVVDGTEAG